jgi:hypothetical protein
VGTTGIEPVTPTMSTQRPDGKYREITALRRVILPKRSRSDHGNLGHFLGASFENRRFAEAVRLRNTRHSDRWLRQ